jgi:signal transduction histidine kinase
VRIVVSLGCTFASLGVIIIGLLLTHQPDYASIVALPIACIAYLFRARVVFISMTLLILLTAQLTVLTDASIFVSWKEAGPFLVGTVLLYSEAYCIHFLRKVQDMADVVRWQSQVAEQQLTHAYEHQQHLNELKDQFLFNISHELRTPLTEVKGYINLLTTCGDTLNDETHTMFLQNAAHGCDELELLVNNVLDASRTENDVKSPNLQDVLIRDMVIDLSEHMSEQEHTLHVEIPDTIIVKADLQQLRQIFRNLLSNAYKYTPVHTPVIVSATICDGSLAEPFAQICVQDAGPGIAAEDIPLLFQKFSRLKRDMNGAIRGTGLGLYISKKFVEGMGGRIWVESEGIEGHGSRFCFTLPLAKQSQITSMDEIASPSNQ